MCPETSGPWFITEYKLYGHYFSCNSQGTLDLTLILVLSRTEVWQGYSEVDEQLLLSIYHLIIGFLFLLWTVSVIQICFYWYHREVGRYIWVWLLRTLVISCSWLSCLSFHTSRTFQCETNVSVDILGHDQISRTFRHRPNVSMDVLDRTKCPIS